jgi:hypothetical protein
MKQGALRSALTTLQDRQEVGRQKHNGKAGAKG